MTIINIRPMPENIRKIPKKWRPGHPPVSIFENCGQDGPTPDEIEEARELFKLLDEESKDWWGRRGIFEKL
jgi:hypothetical protein